MDFSYKKLWWVKPTCSVVLPANLWLSWVKFEVTITPPEMFRPDMRESLAGPALDGGLISRYFTELKHKHSLLLSWLRRESWVYNEADRMWVWHSGSLGSHLYCNDGLIIIIKTKQAGTLLYSLHSLPSHKCWKILSLNARTFILVLLGSEIISK